MVSLQTFHDITGARVDIDRLDVRDAWIERVGDWCTIAILHGADDGSSSTLPIRARKRVERWLGRRLDTYRMSIESPRH